MRTESSQDDPSCVKVGAVALSDQIRPRGSGLGQLRFVQRAPAWGVFVWRHAEPGTDNPRCSSQTLDNK